MTNQEIIEKEVVKNGLMNKEEIEVYNECGVIPDFMTFKEWNRRGYKIKKGSKAMLVTKLWMKTKKKKDKKKDATDDNMEDTFVLVKTYLFKDTQVEKIKIEK